MDSQIEVNIVLAQYEQNSFEGLFFELLELGQKWKLQTTTTVFSVTQHPKAENLVKTEHKVKRLETIKGKPFGLSLSQKIKKNRS
jgi:hypothetical protein